MVEKTTFSSYTQMVKGKIAPYFRNTGLTLDGIQAKHIQSFYLHELKTVSSGISIILDEARKGAAAGGPLWAIY